jgi:hypothetical protein
MDALQLKSLIREALTEAKKAKDEKKDDKKATPKKDAKKDAPKKDAKKSTPKAEAKPKSTGKLVDLKKEKEALKAMQEALGKYMVNEGENEAQLEAAFAHQQSYINEMAKIKDMTEKLAEKKEKELKDKIKLFNKLKKELEMSEQV